MTEDTKHFKLNKELDHFEYLRIPINIISEDFIQEYDIRKDGCVYMKIRKGIYGLP